MSTYQDIKAMRSSGETPSLDEIDAAIADASKRVAESAIAKAFASASRHAAESAVIVSGGTLDCDAALIIARDKAFDVSIKAFDKAHRESRRLAKLFGWRAKMLADAIACTS